MFEFSSYVVCVFCPFFLLINLLIALFYQDVVRNRLAEKLSRKRSSYLSRRQRAHEPKSSHSSVRSFGIESIFDNLSEEGFFCVCICFM